MKQQYQKLHTFKKTNIDSNNNKNNNNKREIYDTRSQNSSSLSKNKAAVPVVVVAVVVVVIVVADAIVDVADDAEIVSTLVSGVSEPEELLGRASVDAGDATPDALRKDCVESGLLDDDEDRFARTGVLSFA